MLVEISFDGPRFADPRRSDEGKPAADAAVLERGAKGAVLARDRCTDLQRQCC